MDLVGVQTRSRLELRGDGRLLCAVGQGSHHPFLYPLCTPAGVPVTENGPFDYSHHHSVWLAHGAVNGYEMWVEEARFSAPGSIGTVVATRTELESATGAAGVSVRQTIEWRDPTSRALVSEDRVWQISVAANTLVVDVFATFRPASPALPVTLDATNHGLFAVRVHDQLDELDGGQLRNDVGGEGEAATNRQVAGWVQYRGAVVGRPVAVTVYTDPRNGESVWHTQSYGLMLVNPIRHVPKLLRAGDSWTVRFRVAATDGWPDDAATRSLAL